LHDKRIQAETLEANAPPDMPFKGNAWAKLGIRQLIKHAVEGGYDSIGWTTGEQQADRYDLSKHLDTVKWNKSASTLTGMKSGNVVFSKPFVTEENLSQY